ncbi:hypothetical protein JTE90_017605 [Oedothorax gibbosus]|uniref:Uncharacterized protein n=1 Tax=Oedothorax gibbosus TaxID=931172 RepID=A0AAV6U4W1_9ARAC|nr:hypothetical protein JTE90_017605 [Oedothorax gibbosus]
MDSKSVPETSILKSRLCSAVHFLLECFGSMHYLDSARCISFVLKDIRTYLNQMDSTLLKEAFAEVPFTTLNEFGSLKQETSDGLHITDAEELRINNELGYLKETSVAIDLIEDGEFGKCEGLESIQEETSAELDSFEGCQLRSDIHTGELRLLFFVCYLSINRKTHLKKIFRDFCDLVPREVSKGLSFAPEVGKLSYFKKHDEYFRIDSSRHLELQEAFYSSSRYSRNGKEQRLSTTNNIVAPDKELVSRRIRSSVMYLKTFFELKSRRKRKVMGVILQVLEDVERFFSISSILDKVDMIRNSFVPLFSKDTFTIESSYSPSGKVVPYIDEHERKMLYFYYLLTIRGPMKYNSLFYAFYGTNGVVKKDSPTVQMSDFEQLLYFTSLSRLFTVDDNGTVKPCPLPDLNLHESIKSYVFKSDDSEISNDKKSAKNLSLQSQDIWCKDNLIYKRLCFFISYLLHSFGQQTCDRLMNCISYVFPDIEMFLSELTMEKQQEMFSSIPFTILKSNNSIILIDAWELDSTYASICECFQIHLVANVALCDKKCAYELIQDFLISLPNKFKLFNNGRWLRKLKSSKFLDCDTESNVALPNLFYSRTGNTNSVPQNVCSARNNLSDDDHTPSSIESLDSNHSNYTTFEESASFLLSVFGPLSSKLLMECISHSFPKNAKLLNGWSEEEWHKMFLSFSSVVLKDGNLQLIEPFEFIRRRVSLTKLINLFTTCYLVLKGTTHYTIVLQKLYQLAPEAAFPDFVNASNPKWRGFFSSKSNLFTMTSRGYMTLPLSSFKTAIAVKGVSSLSELQLRNEDNVFSAIRNATTDKELEKFSREDQVFDSSSIQFHGLKIAHDYPDSMTDEDLITFSTDDQELDSTSKQVDELKFTLDRSHDGLNSTTNCPELKLETFVKSFTLRDSSPVNTKCCHVMSDENIKKQPCHLTESNYTNGSALIFSKSVRSPVNQEKEIPPGIGGNDAKWLEPPIAPEFSDITNSSAARHVSFTNVPITNSSAARHVSFTNVPISTTVNVPLCTNKNESDGVPIQRSVDQVPMSTTTVDPLDSNKTNSSLVLNQRRSVDQVPMSTTTDVYLDTNKSKSDCVPIERHVDQVSMSTTTVDPLDSNKNNSTLVLNQRRSVDQVPMSTTTDVYLDTNKSKSDCLPIERRVDQVSMSTTTDVPLNTTKNESDCVPIQRNTALVHQQKTNRRPIKSRSRIIYRILGYQDHEFYPESTN